MEKQLNIYIVSHIESDSIDAALAYFDSKEKAEAFILRFKTSLTDYEILEVPLNPKYIVNKLEDPYHVSFRGKEAGPSEVEIYHHIEQAEEAEKEEYIIEFFTGNDSDLGWFRIMVFAASEEEAIAKGTKKRDEVVASGEWDKAYQESFE